MPGEMSHLLSPADIAYMLGVNASAVSNWIKRHDDFPEPLVTVARGRTALFDRNEIRDWYNAHNPNAIAEIEARLAFLKGED